MTVVQLGCLAMAAGLAPLSTGIYLPALPQVGHELNASASATQATLTAFLVGMAIGQLLFGPLSDQVGRRKPLLIGMTGCVLASIGCAFAPTIEALIALRVLQGLTGCAGMVLSRAIIIDRVSGTEAARWMGMLVTIMMLTPVVSPLIGAGVLLVGDWRTVFLAIAVLSTIVVIGTARLVPESLPNQHRRIGFTELIKDLGLVVRAWRFWGLAWALGLSFGAMYAYIAAGPFIFQNLFGLSPTMYAVVASTLVCATAASSAYSTRLLGRRVSTPGRIATTGAVLVAIAGLAILIIFLGRWESLLILAVALIPFMIGLGLTPGNLTALALDEVRQAAGTGSAVMGALQNMLGAITAPLVGLAGDRTGVPMAIVLAVMAFASLAILVLTRRTRTELR